MARRRVVLRALLPLLLYRLPAVVRCHTNKPARCHSEEPVSQNKGRANAVAAGAHRDSGLRRCDDLS